MNLDFEIETVIAIVVCIAIIFCVKYGLNFYIKLKEINRIKHFSDLYSSYINRTHLDMKGSDFDIDKNAEKQK